nr:PREDICTED: membrane-spanning 4-domains subfamily A member 3-like [Bos indicus]
MVKPEGPQTQMWFAHSAGHQQSIGTDSSEGGPSRPQMASQEADPTELPAACAGEAPGSLGEAAAEDSSAYRPIGRSQNHPEVLRALGAVQILNGAVILALGGCMHALQNLSQASNYFFLLIVSTGYPIWGAIFFIVSGIVSTLAGKKPTKTLLETSMGLHTSSAVMALVGIVFLSMNLFANDPLLKSCQSSRPPDLCIYMEASSNGLVSLMLVLTLLEMCIACSVVALWLKANCWHLRKPADSVVAVPGEQQKDSAVHVLLLLISNACWRTVYVIFDPSDDQ